MKLLIRSSMIFFGTLMAAAVVALGEPAQAEVAMTASAASSARQHAQQAKGHFLSSVEFAAHKTGFSLR